MRVKVLIVAGDEKEEEIRKRKVGRLLLWGLQQSGIAWEIYQPWKKPTPDLKAFDALLCWSNRQAYRMRKYVLGAQRCEEQARAFGIPVINSVTNCGAPHSFFLHTWRAHGLPCARSQRFSEFEEIRVDYPLLLRRDGIHRGQDVFLVHTPEQARQLITERKKDAEQDNFDLAIEFVDTCGADGYYRKHRCYVVGEQIIPRHVFLSKHWLVNFGQLIVNEHSVRENQAYLREGVHNETEVREVARLTGSDIVALDYSPLPDGHYIYWEANRHFLMLGDTESADVDRFDLATGHNAQARRRMDESLGLAFGKLVMGRIR